MTSRNQGYNSAGSHIVRFVLLMSTLIYNSMSLRARSYQQWISVPDACSTAMRYRHPFSCTISSSTQLYESDQLSYELIDSGDKLRLERFGSHLVERSCPSAIWPKQRKVQEWNRDRLKFHGLSGKGGNWKIASGDSVSAFNNHSNWKVTFEENHTMQLFLSENGQIGCFPEQNDNWRWIHDRLKFYLQSKSVNESQLPIKVMNGFAYTGGSTIAALRADHKRIEVTHVDAAKSFVEWTRDNIQLSSLHEGIVRYRAEDCVTFLEREIRRGNRYHALILDPPAFGRAEKGKTWKLDRDLETLINMIPDLLHDDPAFVLFTCHDPDWPAEKLSQLLRATMKTKWPRPSISFGEMVIEPTVSTSGCIGNSLPMGNFVRWTPKK